MKILMVHGVGYQEDSHFELDWEPAILMVRRAEELEHEYRDVGGHSCGALKGALSQVLRDGNLKLIKTTKPLRELINSRLPSPGYEQHCAIDWPKQQLDVLGSRLGNDRQTK